MIYISIDLHINIKGFFKFIKNKLRLIPFADPWVSLPMRLSADKEEG